MGPDIKSMTLAEVRTYRANIQADETMKPWDKKAILAELAEREEEITGQATAKPLAAEQERLSGIAAKKPVVWICTYCGAQYADKTPFPNPCKCGNIIEDAYRLKEVVDYEDEKAGRPLADAGNSSNLPPQADSEWGKDGEDSTQEQIGAVKPISEGNAGPVNVVQPTAGQDAPEISSIPDSKVVGEDAAEVELTDEELLEEEELEKKPTDVSSAEKGDNAAEEG